MTNPHERPFHPEIGSGVRDILFELISPTSAIILQSEIRQVINNFEPRVDLYDIKALGDIDRNGYYVSIEFAPINFPEPVTIELFLERLR
jgi:phage baseplate assembly protein W